MKQTINQNTFIQLLGLLALAKHQAELQKSTGEAIAELLGTDYDTCGEISDAIYGHWDVRQLLGQLKIEIELAKGGQS